MRINKASQFNENLVFRLAPGRSRVLNLREKLSPGPGFEHRSPALCPDQQFHRDESLGQARTFVLVDPQ